MADPAERDQEREWRITIPVQLSISVGAPITAASATVPPPRGGTGFEERVEIDPDYSTREGYDPEFLGGGPLRIELPRLAHRLEPDAAINQQPPATGPPYELPYHHFSVVLNRRRRLAFFTAVNIDGRMTMRLERERDRWIRDPRVAEAEQVGDEFYAKPFDRGHLVRRLDPAWGRSTTLAKTANDDTFHFTNCCPQHAKFNEGKALWAGLEDYLLNRAAGQRKRMTVFTGPVFDPGDPVIDQVQIPLQYWKVAVTTADGDRPVVMAFVISQADLVRPMLEEAAVDVARMFQVPVTDVEQISGVDFKPLRSFDRVIAEGSLEAARAERVAITGYEDIVI